MNVNANRFRALTVGALVATMVPGLVGHSWSAEFVILISIDGLNSRTMQAVVDAGQAPTLERLQREGAWTANARTDFTHTITLSNHTCMLTGRPVLQPEAMPGAVSHGWTINDIVPADATLHNTGNPEAGYIASVFDVVHDAGRSTALFASKDKFIVYDQSYNEHAGAGNYHGRDKIDSYCFLDDGPPRHCVGLNRQFLAEMGQRHFNYSFLHYRDTDTAGHKYGWESDEYRAAIATVDEYLAEIVHGIESDPALAGRTAIIVTTDHGGTSYNHADAQVSANYTIPVFVWGCDVGSGDLYAMNAWTRKDPGTTRPDYLAHPQPIRNGDTGNLALQLLGLGSIPGSTINAQQDLGVTKEKKDDAAH